MEHLKLDFLNLNNTVAHTFRGLQAIDLNTAQLNAGPWKKQQQTQNRMIVFGTVFFSELPKVVNRQLRLGDSATKSNGRDDQCGRAEGGQL